ncbi:MAG: J domain-containing protein [Bradymonadaceae bacterium]
MSDMKDRLFRNIRANLNHLLDNVRDFEEKGGLRAVFEDFSAREAGEGDDWEEIGAGATRSRTHQPPPPRTGTSKTIHDYYANLEVPFGSDMETVKAAYRRLMRSYHPDRFAKDPEMEAMATRLSQELAEAYQAVESYLKRGTY